jgi:hypothetical protein
MGSLQGAVKAGAASAPALDSDERKVHLGGDPGSAGEYRLDVSPRITDDRDRPVPSH